MVALTLMSGSCSVSGMANSWNDSYDPYSTVFLLTVNEGRPDERVEVVRPMETEGRKTHVAFAQGLSIGTKWVYSDQITAQPK